MPEYNSFRKDNFNNIKSALEAHHKKVVLDFQLKHSPVLQKVKQHGMTLASTAILAGSILTASPQASHQIQHSTTQQQNAKLNQFLDQLNGLLDKKLNTAEEDVISKALSEKFHLKLSANLQGHHLNEIVGYIGAEQHLRRWDGDTLAGHELQQAGMAPAQGSFGNFDNEEQEKYYVAVQLHELPDWDYHWSTLKPWYRYRKVFVYNPDNKKGAVAVIGDSGPSKWTGKTFGGSPELMKYLGRVDGAQKGKVVILFIDDPENKIALGPADISNGTLAARN